MSKYYNIGGVHLKIDASPSKLPAPTPQSTPQNGEVEVTYRNYSRIPAKAQFRRIFSFDPRVAETKKIPGANRKHIHIPARPGKFTARQPASGSELIAIWQPQQKGVTTLVAMFDVETRAAVLGMLQPDTEVETT